MRRKFTVYGLRFSKTSFWNHINTGFLDPAVATALTACGIETSALISRIKFNVLLQQRLPLAVLKLYYTTLNSQLTSVATALTACGIETVNIKRLLVKFLDVATALTACGIETFNEGGIAFDASSCCNSAYRLRY